jgi:8-oxo-dGTP diphosphatase
MLKVTCAIIIKDNKILVTQRSIDSDHPLKWEFPGGKLNNNETETECIVREIKEELKIKIEVLKPMLPVVHDYSFKKIKLIPFLCSLKSGNIELTEHSDCKWIEIKELKYVDFAEADLKLIQTTKNLEILKKYPGENMNNP